MAAKKNMHITGDATCARFVAMAPAVQLARSQAVGCPVGKVVSNHHCSICWCCCPRSLPRRNMYMKRPVIRPQAVNRRNPQLPRRNPHCLDITRPPARHFPAAGSAPIPVACPGSRLISRHDKLISRQNKLIIRQDRLTCRQDRLTFGLRRGKEARVGRKSRAPWPRVAR